MHKYIRYAFVTLSLLTSVYAVADKKQNLDDMIFADIVKSVDLGKHA